MNGAVLAILAALVEHAPTIIKEIEQGVADVQGNNPSADKAKAVLGDIAKLIGTIVEVI